MMAQPVPHQTTDKKRVKVYELRDNDWFDRGTGFCFACFVPVEDGQTKEPRVIVDSEDQPIRRLLETKIVKDDGFQKQQDTLIVWTDNGVDMALSFQEAEGCASIWKFIDSVQSTFPGMVGGPDDGLSDELAMDMQINFQLPPVGLSTLADLDVAIRTLSQTPGGREALTRAVNQENYISKLIPLVDLAEDLESVPELHRLCNIMKTILLLNDTSIMEQAVSDECILGVVGALEYDPDFPTHKANHRQWLDNQSRYKEVVRIENEQVRRKIHMTYRLQYLKDVVLARIIDDPTFSVLNSLIFFYQVDIVTHLHSDAPGFLEDLFGIFHDPTVQQLRKKEAVLFIQACCAIAKNLQPQARNDLYISFLRHGLLPVINYGMRHDDVSVRSAATDILVSMMDHDPALVRHTIYDQMQKHSPLLTDALISRLLVESDLGIKSQISEVLKVLLEQCPPPAPQPQEARGGELMAQQNRLRAQAQIHPQQDLFLANFYDHSAVRLFKPLIDLEHRAEMNFSPRDDGIFSYLNDIICWFIRQHQNRCKILILTQNLASRFIQLLACKEKHLQLVAIRFFRHLVLMQDDFYINHMADKQVLGPILDVLLRTLPRDNLLCSACLELFMLISKEDIKVLIKHLVENYREKIMALAYMETFREILKRYDQTQGFTTGIDPYFESEDELGRRPPHPVARGMMEHLVVDQAQEEYWNTSDDEEDTNHAIASASTNGISSKPLVEYNSDEEDEDTPDDLPQDTLMAAAPSISQPSSQDDQDDTAKENQAPRSPTSPQPSSSSPTQTAPSTGTATSSTASAAAAAAASAALPPERLSEKRRREEDEEEEDALDKLTHQNKRRNSSSAGANSAASVGAGVGNVLRKRRSWAGGERKTALFVGDHVGKGKGNAGGNANGNGGEKEGEGGGDGGSEGSNGGSVGAGGGRKIAISISSAVKAAMMKTAATATDGGEDGGGGGGE